MARKFLYLFAFCVLVFIIGRLALQFYPEAMTRAAFVPREKFSAQAALTADRYADPALWFARPGISGDAAHWQPHGAPAPEPVHAAVFFVHPTSQLARGGWNAPVDDLAARKLAEVFVRGLASPFAGADQLWVPRYRQAALGAFLSGSGDAGSALDLAYGDVAAAFDAFVAAIPADEPIVLVGHSQGAYHLRRLIAERIAHKPLARRIAAAYLVGWPISPAHDLPALGLPRCDARAQSHCVLSWLSFGDPADPAMMRHAADRHPGPSGIKLGSEPMLCTNPLTGGAGDSAPKAANHGSLAPAATLQDGVLGPGLSGARCGADGALLLDGLPATGPYVLPGNNYHVYDIPLFWADVRSDFGARVAAWQTHH